MYKFLHFLYQSASPKWHLAYLGLSLSVLASCLEVASTALTLPLLQLLGNSSTSTKTHGFGFASSFLNFYEQLPHSSKLLTILLALLSLTIIKNGSQYLSNISINAFMLQSGTLLRQNCIKRFLELELPFYTKASLGELLSYVNEQAQRSEQLVSNILELGREVLSTAFLLVFLVYLSPALTLITIVSLVVVVVALRFIIRGVQIYGRQSALAIENFSVLVAEMISGMRVIKSFGTEQREFDRAKQALQDRYQAEFMAYRFNSAVAPLTEVAGITVLLVIILMGTQVFTGSAAVSLSILLTYTLTLLRTLPRVNHLNGLRSQLFLLSGSLENIQGFLANTAGTSLPDGKLLYRSLKSDLTFECLGFRYSDNSEPVLRDLDLKIPQGKVTAIVGHSGSGKSTLVDLILRFHDPYQGSLKVDDIDLRDLQISSWRKAIATVSQDTFLFNTSVRENIAYGRSNATDAEVFAAAKQAYADEFIQALPQGFDTVVGNRGTMLSGGQRQRIAIARAILRDPDILILDEATSALDSTSEQIVQKAIEEVSRDRTVIVIAHRLSTIERADNIVVIHQGRVIEQGTHLQLLNLQGQYWSLYCTQSSLNSSIVELTA
ncbi:MAG: ABC transporter ATP-binding protein/permease [Timaviella obliquedivisa GSE-PSE-MK23-08B]|jgi:ABC-type multidrug transport system fused ATPase/permease subunit|nr:ABC transporter ATP-binding protein/permease [Timaviella obliquedivisa GSE-PSE-MK23-08B]